MRRSALAVLLGLWLAGCTAVLPPYSAPVTDLRTRPARQFQPAGRLAPVPTPPQVLPDSARPSSAIQPPGTPVPSETHALLFSQEILNDPQALLAQLPEQSGRQGQLIKRYSSVWNTVIWETERGQTVLWYDKPTGFIFNYSEAPGGRLVVLTSPFLGTLNLDQTPSDNAAAIVETWCSRTSKPCTGQSRLAVLVGSYKELDFKTFDRMAYVYLFFKDNTRGFLQPAREVNENYLIRYIMGYEAIPTVPEGRRLADLLSVPLQKSIQMPGMSEEGGITVNDLLAKLELDLHQPGW